MSGSLSVAGLVAGFGRKQVLDGLDLELVDGQVTALMGRNGAGKSTLLRVLLGVVRPRSGRVRVLGYDPLVAHRAVMQRIGYVPDTPDCYPWMTADDLCKFLAPQYPTWNRELADSLLDRLQVPRRTKVGAMSRGQGMKLMLAAALAPEPDLLLLDEPFAGLDPLVKEEVLAGVIAALREGERTVLCATHELDIVARIADRVAMLERGRIVRHGTLAEVLGQQEPTHIAAGLQQALKDALLPEGVAS